MRASLALPPLLALTLAATASAASGPSITPSVTGPAGDDGWYRGPVRVQWLVEPTPDETQGCDVFARSADTSPDGATVLCRARLGPVWSEYPLTVRVDQTPPSGVAAAAARPPDNAGWYRRPVAVSWSGSDASSGLAECTALTYAGPDDGAAAPAGTCRDRAGNVSPPVPFGLAYDATAPALTRVRAHPGARNATLRWRVPPDAVRVTVRRRQGRGRATTANVTGAAALAGRWTDRGLRNGRRYTWTLTAVDAAGNAARARVRARPRMPRLRWQRVRRAAYYNLQLFRGRHKVLSTWPSRARYRVKHRWHYNGRTRRLRKGSYRWYVWAGYGARADHRYGRLLASGRFLAG